MDDPLNPKIVYFGAAFTVDDPTDDELKELLIKHGQQAGGILTPEGDVEFRVLSENDLKPVKNGEVGFNPPAIGGIAVTFKEGDRVKTKDGRLGTVLGSQWVAGLVLYRLGQPRIGYFLVKVDFGDHFEYHIRQDLAGDRFRQL